MRLSKAQIKVVNVLQNQGFIWLAAGHPYLAEIDVDGRLRSTPMHGKIFNTLKEHGILKATMHEKQERWVLA